MSTSTLRHSKSHAITDEALLELIKNAIIVVDTIHGRVYHSRFGNELKQYPAGRTNGYRCVRIKHEYNRRSIVVHKLVWMAANLQVVPEGYEIHHKNGRDKNGIDDIELLSYSEHYYETYGYYPLPKREEEILDDYLNGVTS